ncbi:cellulose binding domain-containing protein [Plantactinospora sp. S1510]|uniref:Cellulose binding domain-containing protein n=1 Tax=Plantactinospora alkalitolerans TaxID=2789879 RepID=A0ABS0H5I1_9ACTN|nr:cellulose binding domain-containing protein [Plantactinospora alkalitolerans]MBF9133697.1 cellulose binding domain-containing protein [Plantactinospora alkalitolerans]
MTKVRQRPARTLPVAVLDLLLAAVAAVRGLIRRVARALPVRRGDRALATVIVAAALVAVIGTGFLVTSLLRTPDQLAPLGVAPPPTPVAEASTGGVPDDAEGGATPPASSPLALPSPESSTGARDRPRPATPRPPAPPPTLTGRYASEGATLLNYTASVTISNPGPGPATGWTLVITLPRSTQAVGEVSGATTSRDGNTWTFVPDQSTRQVPADGSVQVRFRVDGSLFDSAPTACTIDKRPCEMTSAKD